MNQDEQLLHDGLNALHIPINNEMISKLLAFIYLIEKWNKAYNLTAIRHRKDMVNLHLLDSLAILPYLEGERIMDVGTGAGLPGIPLAICRPDITFHLIDSNAKKTRFVQQAILELKLSNVHVTHSRIEEFILESNFDMVLTRAFASLPEIIDLTKHVLGEKGALLCMKGQIPQEELIAIGAKTTLIPLNVPHVEAERCLVKIQVS
jgi:16S rRNA (guanine527-N7)-methyltransferase